jgi:hypothetical protein
MFCFFCTQPQSLEIVMKMTELPLTTRQISENSNLISTIAVNRTELEKLDNNQSKHSIVSQNIQLQSPESLQLGMQSRLLWLRHGENMIDWLPL